MSKTRDAALTAGEVVDIKKGKLDANDIKKILPHRDPFLFVDEIIEIEKDRRIVGVKKITGEEEFFKGHFPGNPILPGVIMIEALAQVGGILMLNKQNNLNRRAYFVGVDNVRFKKALIPGDTLTLEVEVTKVKSRIVQLHGVVKVDSGIAAKVDMLFGFAS